MLKPANEICLKCKYQLKQKTITREKMLQLIKSALFEKLILSFETLIQTFLHNSIYFDIKCELFGVNDAILEQLKLPE